MSALLLMYEIAKNNSDSFGGSILIVDDDADIASSFSIGLEDGSFEVYTYNDSLDALLNFKPSSTNIRQECS